MKAMLSVRGTILYIMESILSMPPTSANSSNSNKPWSIYLTGHSLGGALACLMAFDLGLLKAGIKPHQQASNNSGVNLNIALQNASITMYSFGAPRVGNSQYTKV
jgi:predicted lipase